jgi:hypothetical protein
MIANITYRFRIINLMKKSSLYNEGKYEALGMDKVERVFFPSTKMFLYDVDWQK